VPPLQLVVTGGADAGQVFALHPGELIIGREEGSNIQLMDRRVSHNHTLLRVRGEQVIVEDLRSTNGTKVNGVTISGPIHMLPGDQLDLGGVLLVLNLTGDA
jgi:pSer/pThr/pTyr-binding forkhead associated (FHA) protein